MQERRKFKRWQSEKETFFKSDSNTEESQVVDVSLGGMKLIVEKWIEIGTPVSGKLILTVNQKPFYIQGEVVWVKETLDQLNRTCYIVGIKFNKIRTIPI